MAQTTLSERTSVKTTLVALAFGATALVGAVIWQGDRETRAAAEARAYVKEQFEERLSRYPTREEVLTWRREDTRDTVSAIQEVLREIRRR